MMKSTAFAVLFRALRKQQFTFYAKTIVYVLSIDAAPENAV